MFLFAYKIAGEKKTTQTKTTLQCNYQGFEVLGIDRNEVPSFYVDNCLTLFLA